MTSRRSGNTVLMRAVQKEYEEMVIFLLKNGAKVHLRDRHGYTALTDAVLKNNLTICRALIEKGGIPDHFSLDSWNEERINAETRQYLSKTGIQLKIRERKQ